MLGFLESEGENSLKSPTFRLGRKARKQRRRFVEAGV